VVEPKGKSDKPGFQRLQNEVDRMFLDLLRRERVPQCGRAAFRPNADVYYDGSENAVVVKLELPGVDPKDVSLEVEENILRVSGIRFDERPKDAAYQQMEITYGRFERAVMLPPEVDAGKASADYRGGYLEIVLPLRPRSISRRIPITAEEETEEGQGR
jgi:HSP20 family protein